VKRGTATGVRRVGILGAGYISDFHIQALQGLPDVEIAAVCDCDGGRALAQQRRWKIPLSYDAPERMLRDGKVDTVHVLSPPAQHAATALACLEAGCDVFLEKPAGVGRAECNELVRAARDSRRVLGVNHNARFHPAFRRLLAEIREWRLGGIQHVTACVNVPLRQLAGGQHGHWMFREPGNIVLEQAPHPLSQIQMLVGDTLETSALATGRRELNTGATFYDTWQVSLECAGGTAQCFLSFGRECADNWLHVIGQDGTAFADLRRNTVQLTGKSRFMEPLDHFREGMGWMHAAGQQALANLSDYCLAFLRLVPSRDPFIAGMRGSVAAFYEALRAGVPPPTDMEQAAGVIATCEDIANAAAVRGQEVSYAAR